MVDILKVQSAEGILCFLVATYCDLRKKKTLPEGHLIDLHEAAGSQQGQNKEVRVATGGMKVASCAFSFFKGD